MRKIKFSGKAAAVALAASLALSTLAGCGGAAPAEAPAEAPAAEGEAAEAPEATETASTYDTMVIGTQAMNGVFSPFFYSSAYDAQVNDLIFSPVVKLNPNGEVVDNLGHVEVAQEGEQYVYTVTLQDGLVFSDGEPVTIDDLIFTYYVMADPTYDGLSTFSTLDIDGMADYVNSSKFLWKAISEAGKDNTDFTYWTQEDQDAFWSELETAGAAFAQEIVDYCVENGMIESAEDVAGGAGNWGFELPEGSTAVDFFNTMFEAYGGDLKSLSDTESAGSSLFDLMDAKWSGVIELAAVDSIKGIQKVDDLTCTVTFNSANISGDKLTAWQAIMPEHYYGASFKKGDLSSVKALNSAPMGCGPYTFESYDNNIVTLKANPNYFKGQPKIPTVKVQAVNEEDKVDLVLNSEIDITDPSASLEIIAQLDENADIAAYNLVDNPGYGYIGINAERIPDINVRKGLMHLMNRAPAVSSYYGDMGQVIERPMTPTVAEYPDDATEYYGYDPEKALEYFKAAGYEQKDGKLVKDGEQLVVNAAIGDASTHPSTPILTQMANDMEAMGAQLVVNDMVFSNLSNEVNAGTLDMWVMAWGNSTDCDLTQIFGSNGNSNYQHYYSDEIDAIQAKILKTVDFDERAKLVAEELDMIMEAAVYMPVYQRKNMEIYNATTLNLDTLPEETTTYYNYVSEIEQLQMQ